MLCAPGAARDPARRSTPAARSTIAPSRAHIGTVVARAEASRRGPRPRTAWRATSASPHGTTATSSGVMRARTALPFGVGVRVEARVAVEVVGGDVEQRVGARRGRPRDALEPGSSTPRARRRPTSRRRPRRAASPGCRRRTCACPRAASIAPMSAVVVLLPLVPPMSDDGRGARSADASSSSPMTWTPAALDGRRARGTAARRARPPPGRRRRAAPRSCPPSARATPRPSRRGPLGGEPLARRAVVRDARARRARQDGARPRRRRSGRAPRRSTVRPRTSITPSPQLHRGPRRPAPGGWR